MSIHDEEIVQLTQKNAAHGFKATQAVLNGAEQLLQLQLNYIRHTLNEQAKFAQQLNINTWAQDVAVLQQTRTQQIVQTGKEAMHIMSDIQADLQHIANEQQKDAQKDSKATLENFSLAPYFDPTLLYKTFEQFWSNTSSVFDSLHRFTQTATEHTKKESSPTNKTAKA